MSIAATFAPPADPVAAHLREASLTARLAALQAMHAQMIVCADRSAAFTTMVRSVRRLVGCDVCALYLADPSGLRLAAADGFDAPPPALLRGGGTAAEQAFAEEYLVHIADPYDAPALMRPGEELGSEVAVAVSSSRGAIGAFDLGSRLPHAFSDQDLQLIRIVADQTAFSLENLRLLGELTATRDAIIHGMALLAESRDGGIGGHLTRICAYTRTLAERLRREPGGGVSEDWVETLARAAALHDIGKVGIPDSILLKPEGLTPAEYDVMKTHTTIGGELLQRLIREHGSFPVLELAAEVAEGHHELWDGSGYPHGLAGEAIPLSARIVGICDVYDALTSKRPYKIPATPPLAREYLRRHAGSRFDPRLVGMFLEVGPRADASKESSGE